MRFSFKILLFILIVSIFNIYTISAGLPACCYLEKDEIRFAGDGICNPEEINVGPADFSQGSNPDIVCKIYEDKRRGCRNLDGSCSPVDSNGKRVYDISEVLSKNNANEYCKERVLYIEACSDSANTNTGLGSISDSEINTGGSQGGVGSNQGQSIFETVENSDLDTVQQEACSKAGNPFGVFVNKFSCESIEVAGEYCIFNPYLGGILSTKFVNDDYVVFNQFESSCISKSQVRQCFDYKTKENCEVNPAIGKSLLLDLGCEWVPSSDFVESNFFNKKLGICISKAKSDEHINPFIYAKRGNLLSNPSFEKSEESWTGLSATNIVLDDKTYQGIKSASLQGGDDIEQRIEYLAEGVSYSPFLYVKPSNDNPETFIELEIRTFNKTGEIYSEYYLSSTKQDLSSLKKKEYVRVDFEPYLSSKNVEYIIFKLRVSGPNTFNIDAVSFQADLGGSVSQEKQIFKVIQSIPSKASYCQLCYEGNNLNLCTDIKSDLLGDCSYLVNGAEFNYAPPELSIAASEDNIYATNNSWQSQSLANSKMFCELYLTENKCTDSNNYVNSKFSILHTNTPNNLCKWDGSFGCFKDTDDNNLPDIANSRPILRSSVLDTGENFEGDFLKYVISSSTTNPKSDFELSCDTLPPQSYIYFTAVNSSREIIILDDSTQKLIGNVQMHLEANDISLESCNPFSIENKLYREDIVNEVSTFSSIPSNQILENLSIKEFFASENLNLVDGKNNFSFMFYDQSGNRGKEWNFNFNMDVNAPSIQITGIGSEDFLFDHTFGRNSNLDFKFRDYSQVSSCSYVLSPLYGDIREEYYTPNGDFNFTPSSNVEINDWLIPIFNSSINPDTYMLTLSCKDIFDQESQRSVYISVDYNTDLVVVEPRSFQSYELDIGYMNSNKSFKAISTELSLDSCSFNFAPNQDFVENVIDIETDSTGFEVLGYEDLFHQSITGTIDFTTDGIKKGSITCRDNLGNVHSENLSYYYDTKKPELLNYRIFDMTPSSSVVSVLNLNDVYYTIRTLSDKTRTEVALSLNVSGTLSYVANYLGIEVHDQTGTIRVVDSSNYIFESFLNETTDIAIINVTNFELDRRIYQGLDTNETGLYLLEYFITVKDKAGNEKEEEIKYFYDDSTPQFNFSGDITYQDAKTIYTKEENPQISLSFNSPTYRTFTCRVNIKIGSNTFSKSDFLETNKLEFTLNDIAPGYKLREAAQVKISLDCTDIYGLNIRDTFTLTQDTTAPILKEINLAGGNLRYFKNGENIVYDSILDKINFIMEDTNEERTTCEYKISSLTNAYYCNTSTRSIDFTNNGAKSTQTLNLLEGGNPEGGICTRSNQFSSLQTSSIASNNNLETQIKVDAICYDKVALSSERKTTYLNITYTKNMLTDFKFEYTKNGIYAIVTSINDFDNIALVLDGETSPIATLINPIHEGEEYIYASATLDLSNLPEGKEIKILAQAYNAGVKEDMLQGFLMVDKTSPTLIYSIPQVSIKDWSENLTNKTIYAPRFSLSFVGKDNFELNRIEMKINGIPAYDSNNLSDYYGVFVQEPDSSINHYIKLSKKYSGEVIIENLVPRQETNVKLIAYDKNNNKVEKEINIVYDDRFNIIIEESNNAFLDEEGIGWVTKSLNPILKLKSTLNFINCITSLETNTKNIGIGSEVIFDVSKYPNIKLNEVKDKITNLYLSCTFNFQDTNTLFKNSYKLRYVDSLPDYTISSDSGFILTDEPYITNITLNSVGVYRRLSSCEYTLNSPSKELDLINPRTFKTQLNFTSFGTGEYDFKVSCLDFLGNQGPTKTYTFKIDKNPQLKINDIKLSKNADVYKEYKTSKKIYIGQSQNLDLSFSLNKKGVSCQSTISLQTPTFLTRIMNFVTNLFNLNYETISNVQDEIYSFKASNLNFDEEAPSLLDIICTRPTGEQIDAKYNVIYNSSLLNINIVRSN